MSFLVGHKVITLSSYGQILWSLINLFTPTCVILQNKNNIFTEQDFQQIIVDFTWLPCSERKLASRHLGSPPLRDAGIFSQLIIFLSVKRFFWHNLILNLFFTLSLKLLFGKCATYVLQSWQKYLAQSKESSKIGQDFKNLSSNFACFLTAIVKV